MAGKNVLPKPRFDLTRNFAIACGVVLAIAGIGIGKFNLDEANRQLISMAESNNSDLGRAISSSLWPFYGIFVNNAYEIGADAVRVAPQTAALKADLRAMLAGSRILKIKIYDQIGFTVFSTEPAEIGESYATDSHFRLAASGRVQSKLEFHPRFDDLGRPVEDRWVLSSYVPVTVPDVSGGGVFEVYSDVTGLRETMRNSFLYHSLVAGGVFLATFALLLTVVWRADRTIQREQTRSLALAAGTARAEAANQAKTEFLTNMSHELRTPLNAVIGFADIIVEEMAGPVGNAVYKSYAGNISEAGKHLLAIINDVLDLTAIESGKTSVVRVPFDGRKTVNAAAELLRDEAAAKRLTFVLDCSPDRIEVMGDERRTRQILINLLSNAVKFTPEGGCVRLGFARGPGNTAIFSVADNGIGMNEEDVPIALSAFGQVDASLSRRYEGAGLGLTLANRFAELMNGGLVINSRSGQGTTVRVTLPCTSTEISLERVALLAG